MKKSLFIFFSALMACLSLKADLTADWMIHMPFDQWPTQVVETPGRVYVLSRTFEYKSTLAQRDISSNSLFYYDKDGDEMISINARTNASGNAVACIGYNVDKKYLLVVYTDCNIDFIYDDGRVFNVQALKSTSIPGRKLANSITFDNTGNRAYVATSFGYIALNDERHEVAESRNYGENLQSIAKCGSNIVLCKDNEVYFAPALSQRFNFSDYTLIPEVPPLNALIPLNSDNFMAYQADGQNFGLLKKVGDSFTWESAYEDPKFFGIQQTAAGYTLTGNVRLYRITKDGEVTFSTRPEEDWGNPAASYDRTKIWTLAPRKGLRGYTLDNNELKLAHDYIRPNAPATYISTSVKYHPTVGIMAGSNGPDLAFNNTNQSTPATVSALKGGFWKEYGPTYTNTDRMRSAVNYFGLAIDPNNTDYVYRGSTSGGLLRINLANPSDLLLMANPSNANASTDFFVKVAEDQSAWRMLCRFTTPQFTADGTMWTLYNNRNEGRDELWYWPAADRAAVTSPATYRPMKVIPIPEFPNGNDDVMITLTRNSNLVMIGGMQNSGTFMVYDHRGTPDNTSDDRYVYVQNPYDQDGGGVNFLAINAFAEDPETGLVWIMSQRGLFTVNPATIFENPNQVNRIKVARNDGTNLADYLLNEINVNHMSIDGEGRKWFSTSNGLVCTSRDGRQILGEFTMDNSYLPDNNVYATAYNPENNSLLVATGGGLVEMFPSGSGGSSSDTQTSFRVYPNPVEPDYYGWVRIDNLTDGSLVKITDSTGGVVKELGPVQGGSVEWDVSGLNNTRVATGVYYIMVSPGSNSGGKAQISKILVLN